MKTALGQTSSDGRPVGITIQGLKKAYHVTTSTESGGFVVLDGFDLTVYDGEFLTFFGPNGCGKTTLLYIIAGLTPYRHGIVDVYGKPPGSANVGFVFQGFQASLLPWRSNLDNVAFPLELRGIPRGERRQLARQLLCQIAEGIPERDFPYRLSGGQQQMLSIARALLASPKVLLMDEPFSQLDYESRMNMQRTTLQLWAERHITVLFVSHDIDEALLLGSRAVILSSRPTRVVEILTSTLAAPRSHDLLKSPEFFRLRAQALEAFKKGLGR